MALIIDFKRILQYLYPEDFYFGKIDFYFFQQFISKDLQFFKIESRSYYAVIAERMLAVGQWYTPAPEFGAVVHYAYHSKIAGLRYQLANIVESKFCNSMIDL